MFDVGFSEILLCGIVALLVLGPEKLPGAVRTASLWIGRFRRAFNDVKSEIEREIGADDIRRQLHNEQVMKKLESGKQQLQALQAELRAIEQNARRDAIPSVDHPPAALPATQITPAALTTDTSPTPVIDGAAPDDQSTPHR